MEEMGGDCFIKFMEEMTIFTLQFPATPAEDVQLNPNRMQCIK